MITPNDFTTMLAEHPTIEAIIRMSRDGLPLDSYTRGSKPVDEIVSIAAGLFAAAVEARLLRRSDSGRLLLCAEHGSLYCRAFDARTLLMVLTNEQQTEQQLDTLLDAYDHK
jgi:predicted regulator of Ras-like GTPase activity (Roadblock/LC7/MglB family)